MFDSAKKIKNIILVCLLVLITLIISFQNYDSGTYLSGWDTLHSEFDFGIAFKRALSPAFQDHQGLGAVSAQSHLGDLPRITFLFLLSFIFSENFLRYSYVFLMLIIGPLGVYLFIKEFLTKNEDDEEEDSTLFPAFIGAIFYLTNLSVVQHFNIPLEMFLTLFGFLGFIFLYVNKVLKTPNKANIKYLIIFSFLLSPASHTATLFYMFLLILAVYIGINFLVAEDKKIAFKNSFIAFSLVLGVNLFWILPNVYFILTHGKEVSDSKIHSLFSDQAYLSNLAFGNLSDIALLKNYLFIWQVWDGGRFVPLLDPWAKNLETGIIYFGYLLFALAVLGVGLALVKKEKKLYSFIIIFFLSVMFISSSNSIVGNLFDFLRDNVPFMKEALRFPFNKFSTIFSFVIAIFLAYFYFVIFQVVRREALKISSVLIVLLLSLVYFLPAFRGELVNPLMRINFSSNYFELFDYFKNQPEYGRVADLPIHSVYGWSYYGFGYQGAGFLWFGIDKPLFNREFDRWNVKNEDYYNEMSWALYNDNSQSLRDVLDKYQIRWIIVDKDVFAPNEEKEILNFESIEESISQVPNLKLDKKIGETLFVYKYSPEVDFARSQILQDVNYLSNEFYRESEDLAYRTLGNYYSDRSDTVSYGLKTKTEVLNPSIISSDEVNFYVKNINNLKLTDKFADITFQDNLLTIKIENNSRSFVLDSGIDLLTIENEPLKPGMTKRLKIGPNSQIKIFNSTSEFLKPTFDQFANLGKCGVESFGSRYVLEREGEGYSLISSNINTCIVFSFSEFFSTKKFDSYLFEFNSFNQNSNSYLCSSKNEGKECNKRKTNNMNQFVFSTTDTDLILFNEPVKNLEGSSVFSNLKITLLQELGTLDLNIDPGFFEGSESVVIRKNPNLSGNLVKFGFNPRVCATQDLVSSRVGLYESGNLNICDSFNVNFNPNSYHLVEVTSKNNSGLPLRVCLQNIRTNRCDLFIPLPKNKEFTSDFLILPPFLDSHSLSITNQVIEGNVSSNEIAYLSVQEVDYLGLFQLKAEKPKDIYFYGKYFERGFIAFCGIAPCPYEHVLVNNWANGWVLPENYDKNQPIVIIFWPNLLAFVGVAVFFGLLVWVLRGLNNAKRPIAVDKK